MGQKASEFKFMRMLGVTGLEVKGHDYFRANHETCTSVMWKLVAHKTLDGGLSEGGDILCPAVKAFGLRNICIIFVCGVSV